MTPGDEGAPFAHLRPFPVDPAVMAAIRPMHERDAPSVAALHHAAMGRSLWARLGRPFLAALYRELLRQDDFLARVYEEDGEVRGFIAGTTHSEGLFLRTLKSGWPRLLLPLVRGLVRNPSAALPLLATPFYFRRSGLPEVPAESLFCSFVPHLRGRRVSGHVNKVLFDELLRRGHEHVKVTTEIDNEGAVRQLLSWGFEPAGDFFFYGKTMRTFRLRLRGHPRLVQVPFTAGR